MKKPFFYRLEASEFASQIFTKSDSELAEWVKKIALDLLTGDEEKCQLEYSKSMIKEANEYAEKRARGGKQKHANRLKQATNNCEQSTSRNTADTSTLLAPTNNRSSNSNRSSTKKEREKKKSFTKPTLSEIEDYASEASLRISPQTFYDFYESNGWKVGKNAMKDWKATARGWSRKEGSGTPIYTKTLDNDSSIAENGSEDVIITRPVDEMKLGEYLVKKGINGLQAHQVREAIKKTTEDKINLTEIIGDLK